jgi:hypothetical protein
MVLSLYRWFVWSACTLLLGGLIWNISWLIARRILELGAVNGRVRLRDSSRGSSHRIIKSIWIGAFWLGKENPSIRWLSFRLLLIKFCLLYSFWRCIWLRRNFHQAYFAPNRLCWTRPLQRILESSILILRGRFL